MTDDGRGTVDDARAADGVDDGRDDTPGHAALAALDLVERTAILTFESDAWIARAARAEEPVLVGELAGYRLARVVARGAQGTVYEATEPRTGRRVAIKRLLREGPGGDGLEDTRFSRETSVLGALAHPNIVALLSAPEADGARLLVMEWVDGESFDQWADGVWRAQPVGEAVRTIARALADAARAVAAAHALGIVHRDLKPSNVLVARDGAPKVLDFGLAKPVEGADATRTNGFAGTPSWAAPEQIDGDARAIGPRADVHALGLLAFRALAGRGAFDATLPIGALFEAIRTRVPAFTATDRRRVPKELALVVLRALEKEPARRYANAGAFADDLARFLAGEPVEAHPPGALYLARTLVRRHRTASAALLVALAAVVAGAGVSLAFAVDATRARRAETTRADEADAARLRAERMNGFFQDLLANLRERDATGTPSTAREIIASAAASLGARATPPDAERDLRETLARALFEIGDYAGAVVENERLVALTDADPGADALERARVRIALGHARQHAGLRSAARTMATEALALLETVADATPDARRGDATRDRSATRADSAMDSRDGSTNDPAATARPRDPALLRAQALETVAFAHLTELKGPQAMARATEAVEAARRAGSRRQASAALSTLALAHELVGEREAAADVARAAVDEARDLGLDSAAWTRLLYNAGYLASGAGRHAEALAFLDEAIALRAEALGDRHPRTVTARVQRALVLRKLGRHDEAVALFESLLAELALPADAQDALAIERIANIERHLGRAYEYRNAEGDDDRAILAYERSLAGLARSTEASVNRIRGPVRFLLAAIARRDGGDAMLATARALGDGTLAPAASARGLALFRAIATQTLAAHAATPDGWLDADGLAGAREDAALLEAEFGAASAEAFEANLALVVRLVRDPAPDLRAEGARRLDALRAQTLESFGADSEPVRRLERLVERPAE